MSRGSVGPVDHHLDCFEPCLMRAREYPHTAVCRDVVRHATCVRLPWTVESWKIRNLGVVNNCDVRLLGRKATKNRVAALRWTHGSKRVKGRQDFARWDSAKRWPMARRGRTSWPRTPSPQEHYSARDRAEWNPRRGKRPARPRFHGLYCPPAFVERRQTTTPSSRSPKSMSSRVSWSYSGLFPT